MTTTVLDKLRAHSYEEGDCWIWTGYVDKNGVPRLNFKRNGKWSDASARRAYLIDQKHRLGRSMFVTTKCGNPKCVNPDHYRVVSRAVYLEEYRHKMYAGSTGILRAAKIAETKRANSELDWEKVQDIRYNLTYQEAKEKYGITKGLAYSIKAGKSWRDFTNPYLQLTGLIR